MIYYTVLKNTRITSAGAYLLLIVSPHRQHDC